MKLKGSLKLLAVFILVTFPLAVLSMESIDIFLDNQEEDESSHHSLRKLENISEEIEQEKIKKPGTCGSCFCRFLHNEEEEVHPRIKRKGKFTYGTSNADTSRLIKGEVSYFLGLWNWQQTVTYNKKKMSRWAARDMWEKEERDRKVKEKEREFPDHANWGWTYEENDKGEIGGMGTIETYKKKTYMQWMQEPPHLQPEDKILNKLKEYYEAKRQREANKQREAEAARRRAEESRQQKSNNYSSSKHANCTYGCCYPGPPHECPKRF
ncbi:MAG: hypothetical protein K2P93_06465 [Alphaproteobacteria bacterium]|nr:hypothetical protein [Alphaproteobacteria bacterium]